MKTILLLAVVTRVAFAQSAAPGGMVFGVVQSNTGTPIPGAWVTIYRDTTDPSKPAPPFMSGAASWKDGAFAFTGLEAGVYHFCASMPGSTWLNPCDWETSRVTAQLNPNQIMRGIVISMKAGVVVPVRIDDAGGFLSTYQTTKPGAHVLVGVTTASGMFQPAAVTAVDKSGRTQQVLVPFDAPVKLVIHSDLFLLANATGVAFTNGHNESSVSVQSGLSASPVTVKITGIKP